MFSVGVKEMNEMLFIGSRRNIYPYTYCNIADIGIMDKAMVSMSCTGFNTKIIMK